MEYRTRYPEGEELERMMVDAGLGQLHRQRLILAAVMVLTVSVLNSLLDFNTTTLWVAIGFSAVVLVGVEMAWRAQLRRNAKRQVPVFGGRETVVTVSDAGLLLETPATHSSMYYPWPLVSKPQLYRKDTVLGFFTPTQLYAIALHGLDAGQRAELLREVQEHAGKAGGEPIPPPMDTARAHTLDITAGQRAEACDITATRICPVWLTLIRCAVLALLAWSAGQQAAELVQADCQVASSGFILIGILAFCAWIVFSYLLHPGRQLLRAASTPAAARVRCRSYLFDTEGQRLQAAGGEGSWAVTGLDRVEAVCRGKSCRVLFMNGQASGLTLPLDAELPPALPAELPAPRRSRLFIPALVVAAVLFAVSFLYTCESAPEEEEPCPEEVYEEILAPIMGD